MQCERCGKEKWLNFNLYHCDCEKQDSNCIKGNTIVRCCPLQHDHKCVTHIKLTLLNNKEIEIATNRISYDGTTLYNLADDDIWTEYSQLAGMKIYMNIDGTFYLMGEFKTE